MDERLKGIIPRTVGAIFDNIRNASEDCLFEVKISMLEVYMEKLRDLLNPSIDQNVRIREHPTDGIYLEGIAEKSVTDDLEVMDLLSTGNNHRKVAQTNMNAVSSRSHSIAMFSITQTNTTEQRITKGKLFLVDLAGSEKISKTGAKGETLEEAKQINKGLLELGNVINALTEGNFATYRNSKLTMLLKDSLGGNSKTTLIITCSPSLYNEAETVNTMRFGMRAKLIKNKPKLNEELSKEQLCKLLEEARAKISKLEAHVVFLEDYIGNVMKQPVPAFSYTGARVQNDSAGALPAPAAASSEEVARLQSEITRLTEEQNSFRKRIEMLTSSQSAAEKKLVISKEQNSILSNKMTVLVKRMQLFDQQNTILSEKVAEMEGINKELLMRLESNESIERKEVDFSSLSVLGALQLEGAELKSDKDLEGFLDATGLGSKDRELITKFFSSKIIELEKQRSKSASLKSVLKEVLSNFQRVVDQDLPSLEQEHRTIVENLRKDECRNSFFFNEKLMNTLHELVTSKETLERNLAQRDATIKGLYDDIKQNEVRSKQKIQSLRYKADILKKCVATVVKKLEDFRTMSLQDQKMKREIRMNDLDLFMSNIQGLNAGGRAVDDANSGAKIIKIIRGKKQLNKDAREFEGDQAESAISSS